MAFGLNINFSGFIGGLTSRLKNIATSKIQNLSSMAKSILVNTTNNALGNNIQSMIGTSLNLNLSKLTGGIFQNNLLNSLNGLPFPSLGSLNLSSLYGIIDKNIGDNLNSFTKNLAKTFGSLNLNEISLNDKISTVIDSQADNYLSELEAGIIAGKTSLNVIDKISNLSNTQIRDFTLNPELQNNFVSELVEQQKIDIFNLSVNSISESSIFDNQVKGISEYSFNSFASSNATNLDFSFFDDTIIEEATISKDIVTEQKLKLSTLTEEKQPLYRKVNLQRYNKEEETLKYIENFDENLESLPEPDEYDVGKQLINLETLIDPDLGEVLGYQGLQIPPPKGNVVYYDKDLQPLDDNTVSVV